MIQGTSLTQKARLRSKSPVHIRTGGETHNYGLRVMGQEDHSHGRENHSLARDARPSLPRRLYLLFFS